jgi:hypothetical protein
MNTIEQHTASKRTWKNVSRTERVVRLVLATIFLATAFIPQIPIVYQIALFAVAGILATTGFLRFCPLYALTNSCSCSAEKDCETKCL